VKWLRSKNLRLQFCVEGNLGVEQTRNRATGLRAVRDGSEFFRVNAGNFRRHVQMRFRDGKTGVSFFQCDGRGRVDARRRETGLAEFRRERHRETARVRCRDEFFGICADAVLEARAERVLRLLERAALGGDFAFAGFQVARPDGGCFAFHKFPFNGWNVNSSTVADTSTVRGNLKRRPQGAEYAAPTGLGNWVARVGYKDFAPDGAAN